MAGDPRAAASAVPLARLALVIGATGLIGRALCRELAARTGAYRDVQALVRRPASGLPASVRVHLVDFEHLNEDTFPAVQDVYCSLGTTRAEAGSADAFRRVDHDYVVHCARLARARGAERFALVSALGASCDSRMLYNRTKGAAERDVSALGFDCLVIARPSLLGGERAGLGQRARPLEALALALMRPLAFLVPPRYRPVDPDSLATALIAQVLAPTAAVVVLESDEIQATRRGRS